VLQAFRECVPSLLKSLNRRIAEIPAGDLLFVNGEMMALLEKQSLCSSNGCLIFRIRAEPLAALYHPTLS
jgi:hypothetical protein